MLYILYNALAKRNSASELDDRGWGGGGGLIGSRIDGFGLKKRMDTIVDFLG